ncbi:hypothetical protein HHK36_001915 [Tetracentron sinense]|uniref:Hydroxyproline-rich glycoprotein n=1 Tax=Tetracentron sinense TaxID=13715 RepID=A0A834ZUI0_TETSI|nr:hypothetical protein HHK36_001915 [Tetracentron sinense]
MKEDGSRRKNAHRAVGFCYNSRYKIYNCRNPKSSDLSNYRNKAASLTMDNSCGWAGYFMLVMELRKKILTFRDIIDLPPCNGSDPINELMIATLEDLHKLYPKIVPSIPVSEMNETSMHQGLVHLYNALKSIEDSSENHKWLAKFRYDNDGNAGKIGLEQFGERVLVKLNYMIKVSREMLDVMDEEDHMNDENSQATTFGDILSESFSDNKTSYCHSPVTPISVLPEVAHVSIKAAEFAWVSSYPPSLLWPLRIQAMAKLKPNDVKHLSFNIFPLVSAQGSSPVSLMNKTVDGPNPVIREAKNNYEGFPMTASGDRSGPSSKPKLPPVPSLMPAAREPTLVSPSRPMLPPYESPPPPPMLPPNVAAAPLPPPMLPSKGLVPSPPPLMPLTKGAAPPPPPPLAVAKALRAKKANTKLKRSTHMGNMYRILKGKVEGSSLDGKSSNVRKSQTKGSEGGKQGMADALAEMTKRSAYFQQIEEDVHKHEKSIVEMKTAINSFQTKEMTELLEFHKCVDLQLEHLTDETQVRARFKGFPTKKLETLWTAATLYSRLNSIVANLESWKIVAPLGQLLDRVESYFNKIKAEVDALERIKGEESKKFQNQNIHFDFNILVRIKELMVDVSSNCMELALKERREAKAATNVEIGSNTERSKTCAAVLWRAFQLAFRVYMFAGGQDDRADLLMK